MVWRVSTNSCINNCYKICSVLLLGAPSVSRPTSVITVTVQRAPTASQKPFVLAWIDNDDLLWDHWSGKALSWEFLICYSTFGAHCMCLSQEQHVTIQGLEPRQGFGGFGLDPEMETAHSTLARLQHHPTNPSDIVTILTKENSDHFTPLSFQSILSCPNPSPRS